MLGEFVICILPMLLITLTSSLEVSDETPKLSDGNTATPLPGLRTGWRPDSPTRRQGYRGPSGRLRHFLLHGKPVRAREPIFVRNAGDLLRTKLLGLFRESMKELEYKVKYLEDLYSEKGSVMVDVSEVLDSVNHAYRDLAAVYKDIDQHQGTVHPVNIVRAYNKLRRSNLVVSTLLRMFSGAQFKESTSRRPPRGAKHNIEDLGIAWSYYDDSW